MIEMPAPSAQVLCSGRSRAALPAALIPLGRPAPFGGSAMTDADSVEKFHPVRPYSAFLAEGKRWHTAVLTSSAVQARAEERERERERFNRLIVDARRNFR